MEYALKIMLRQLLNLGPFLSFTNDTNHKIQTYILQIYFWKHDEIFTNNYPGPALTWIPTFQTAPVQITPSTPSPFKLPSCLASFYNASVSRALSRERENPLLIFPKKSPVEWEECVDPWTKRCVPELQTD